MGVNLRNSLNNGLNTGLRQSISGGTGVFLKYTTVASTSSFTLRSAGTVDYEVDWGDGTVQSYTTNNPAHTYSTAGTYTIKITPAVGSTYKPNFNNNLSDTSIAEIAGTGGSQLGGNLQNAWRGAENMTSFSAKVDTSIVTNFRTAWDDCSGLTSFPLIDTSSGTLFQAAWKGCTNLVSFSLINTSNGTNFYESWRSTGIVSFPALDFSSATNLANAWRVSSSLANYPANMFDTTGTLVSNAFGGAWRTCSLTAQSIENILVSLDTNGATSITLDIAGGTNAGKSTWSTAANDAYDNLITKSWTITFNS